MAEKKREEEGSQIKLFERYRDICKQRSMRKIATVGQQAGVEWWFKYFYLVRIIELLKKLFPEENHQ
jgi:hypothetical protein